MRKMVFAGAATELVTPMRSDFSVDLEKLGELVKEQINAGIGAIVVCAATGEGATLTDDEQAEVIKKAVLAAAGNAPIIACVQSNCTSHAAELARSSKKAGADAILATTPYFNRTSQNGLIKHFAAISEASCLPMIISNVPQNTGMDIAPETYLKLTVIKNLVGIMESSTAIGKTAKAAAMLRRDADIYSGSDDITVPILSLGGKGVISAIANIKPLAVIDMCESFFEGDSRRACDIQLSLMPLIDALFSDINPMPIKYAMNYLGKNVGPCRLPLIELGYDKRFLLEILLNR